MKSPLIPMGAMTGRPDAKRMREVLESYRSVGIDQFMIYPRSGMEYEYMSEEWLRVCEETVRIADELGMEIWLYDEYNWPSGNCRGQVTEGHEEYWPRAIVFEKHGEEVGIDVVRNRYGADILNPDAVARFIKLTHQRYYDRMAPYFGRVIKGIFTDEPSFAYYTRGLGPADPETKPEDFLALPWYDGLEEDYHAVRGRCFRQDVSAALRGEGPEYLWEDTYTLLGNRMREVFIGGMDNWCRAHGIVQTGHLMNEDAPGSVRFNGDPLKMLCRFSQPGMDDITTHMVLDGTSMQLSAMFLTQYAARERAGALAELFALGPVDLPMAHMRQMIWLTACFGVNHYVLAVAAQDARGNIEKDQYYFPTSRTAPWFDCYRELEKAAEEAALTARKEYRPTVRLRFPAKLFMRHAREGESPQGRLFRAFLEQSAAFQIQALYLDEGEMSDLPVLAMDEEGLFIEGERARFTDAAAFAAHVRETVPEESLVYEADGRECRDVLLRKWADGTVTLVNLSPDDRGERALMLRSAGRAVNVTLPAHGVWNGCPDRREPAREMTKTEAAAIEGLTLRLEQPNLLRCLMTRAEPDFRFTLKEPVAGLRLLVRTGVRPAGILLDGKPVRPDLPAQGLPDGFVQLYGATEELRLAAGAHCVTLVDGIDYRFLPAAFILGMFRTDPEGALAPFSGEADIGRLTGMPDYAGTYTLRGSVRVPDAAVRLCADTGMQCAELKLDGESLGWKCWPPFAWDIPEKFRGKSCEVCFVMTTSLLPLFGDLAKLEEEQPISAWARMHAGRYRTAGLLSVPVWETR